MATPNEEKDNYIFSEEGIKDLSSQLESLRAGIANISNPTANDSNAREKAIRRAVTVSDEEAYPIEPANTFEIHLGKIEYPQTVGNQVAAFNEYAGPELRLAHSLLGYIDEGTEVWVFMVHGEYYIMPVADIFDVPWLRFHTTGKLIDRVVQATVDLITGDTSNPNNNNNPYVRGDSIEVSDPNNLWSDVEANASGTAYFRTEPETLNSCGANSTIWEWQDSTSEWTILSSSCTGTDCGPGPKPTTAGTTQGETKSVPCVFLGRWEIETCSLPINRIRAKLETCLLKTDLTGTATFADDPPNYIRSAYPNCDVPPEWTVVTSQPLKYRVTFSNLDKLDSGFQNDGYVTLARATDRLASEPNNLDIPLARSTTVVIWEIVSVEEQIARHSAWTKNGSQWDFTTAYDGSSPEDCNATVVCGWDCSCMKDGEVAIGFYAPESNTVILNSSASAVLGEPVTRTLMIGGQDPDNEGDDPVLDPYFQCSTDDTYDLNFGTQLAKVFTCSIPPGNMAIPISNQIFECLDVCEYICTYCDSYSVPDEGCDPECCLDCEFTIDGVTSFEITNTVITATMVSVSTIDKCSWLVTTDNGGPWTVTYNGEGYYTVSGSFDGSQEPPGYVDAEVLDSDCTGGTIFAPSDGAVSGTLGMGGDPCGDPPPCGTCKYIYTGGAWELDVDGFNCNSTENGDPCECGPAPVDPGTEGETQLVNCVELPPPPSECCYNCLIDDSSIHVSAAFGTGESFNQVGGPTAVGTCTWTIPVQWNNNEFDEVTVTLDAGPLWSISGTIKPSGLPFTMSGTGTCAVGNVTSIAPAGDGTVLTDSGPCAGECCQEWSGDERVTLFDFDDAVNPDIGYSFISSSPPTISEGNVCVVMFNVQVLALDGPSGDSTTVTATVTSAYGDPTATGDQCYWNVVIPPSVGDTSQTPFPGGTAIIGGCLGTPCNDPDSECTSFLQTDLGVEISDPDGSIVACNPVIAPLMAMRSTSQPRTLGLGDKFVLANPELFEGCGCKKGVIALMNRWAIGSVTDKQINAAARPLAAKSETQSVEDFEAIMRGFLDDQN